MKNINVIAMAGKGKRFSVEGYKTIKPLILLKKKPIIPSAKELRENTPSRSAKLRYVIKKNDLYNFVQHHTFVVSQYHLLFPIHHSHLQD